MYHLCDRIVDINGRRLEFPLLEHLVEVVNTSSSLFSNTTNTYKTQKHTGHYGNTTIILVFRLHPHSNEID